MITFTLFAISAPFTAGGLIFGSRAELVIGLSALGCSLIVYAVNTSVAAWVKNVNASAMLETTAARRRDGGAI